MSHDRSRFLVIGSLVLAASTMLVSAARAQNLTAKEYADRGNGLAAQGKLQEAIVEYSNAIRTDPKYAKAYAYRGNTYLRLRNDPLALKDAEEAIKLDPAI